MHVFDRERETKHDAVWMLVVIIPISSSPNFVLWWQQSAVLFTQQAEDAFSFAPR